MTLPRFLSWPAVVGIGLMLGLLIVEIFTHVLGTVGYVAIAGYALWFSEQRKQIYLIAASSTALLIVGYIFAISLDHPVDQATFLVNRASALVVIWFAQYFTLRYRNTQEKEHSQRMELEERKLAEERLKSSLKIYKAIARNFPVGWIGILDENLTYIVADGKGLVRAGIKAADVIGKSFLSLPNTEKAGRYLEEALGGKNVDFEIRFNNRILEVNGSPLLDIHKDRWILVVVHDITTLKETEAELIKALEKERALGEMKSQFVTMASHEFRTPLATILSSTFLLSNYSGDKYEKEKITHLARIKQSVKLLNDILSNFLFLQRLEEGGWRPNREPINLNVLLNEIVNEAESLKHGSQELIVKHSGEGKIVCDNEVLKAILCNLLSNAFKFSHKNGHVLLEAVAMNSLVELSVTDHGIGIPLEDQEHIYDKFFRARNVVNIQGTGLGLSIVNQYLKLLPECSIRFHSISGIKTVFTVSIMAR